MATSPVTIATGLPLLLFQSGQTYWCFIQNEGGGAFSSLAYKSTDGGATWTLVDGTHGFVTLGYNSNPIPAIWDGANTVTFWYQDATGFAGNSFLQQFNIATGLWGLPFAEQAAFFPIPLAIFPVTGGFQVVYQESTAAPLSILTQTWNGASWSASTSVSATVEAMPGFNPANTEFAWGASVLDPAGVLHTIFTTVTFPPNPTWQNRWFYQEVTSGEGLQNNQEFPGQGGATPDLAQEGQLSGPAPSFEIIGGELFWGIVRNNYGAGAATFPAVYRGSPLINPSWTETGNLDPGAASVQFPISPPAFWVNGGTIYLTFNRSNPTETGNQVQLVTTSSAFASSVSSTLTDSANGGPKVNAWSVLLMFTTFLDIGAGAGVVEGPSFAATFTSISSSYFVRITLRGVNRRRTCGPDLKLSNVPSGPSVGRAM